MFHPIGESSSIHLAIDRDPPLPWANTNIFTVPMLFALRAKYLMGFFLDSADRIWVISSNHDFARAVFWPPKLKPLYFLTD